jgi:hypothetical protein
MSDTVTLSVTLHKETPKAWRVSKTGRDTDGAWVPKSLGRMTVIGMRASIELPRHLATAKGLL